MNGLFVLSYVAVLTLTASGELFRQSLTREAGILALVGLTVLGVRIGYEVTHG